MPNAVLVATIPVNLGLGLAWKCTCYMSRWLSYVSLIIVIIIITVVILVQMCSILNKRMTFSYCQSCCSIWLPPVQRECGIGGIVFSCVCLWVHVCLFVCQYDDTWTVWDILVKFSWKHDTVKARTVLKMAAFRCTAVHGWWSNVWCASVILYTFRLICLIDNKFLLNTTG